MLRVIISTEFSILGSESILEPLSLDTPKFALHTLAAMSPTLEVAPGARSCKGSFQRGLRALSKSFRALLKGLQGSFKAL